MHLTTTEPTKNRIIQNIRYNYDLVGNIWDIYNRAPVPLGGEIGGYTEHHYTHDDLYQLTTANGYHLPAPGKKTTYTNTFNYDDIGNITRKLQTHLIVGVNSTQAPAETNYDLWYKYTGPQPHAVTDAGDKLYSYDKDGNMLGWTSKTTKASRTITWDEENRVTNITDSGNGTDFLYDDAGERVVKRSSGNETVYVNRFYAVKNGDLGTKHIFANETRIVTKLEKDGGSLTGGVPGVQGIINGNVLYANGRGNPSAPKRGINRRLPGTTAASGSPPIEKFEFFYHGDHLGSSNFITDDSGQVYQDLEYFPYGETWVEDGGSGQMPYYRFTGQEFDPETGLYYYGARYYDPVLSRWISVDPALKDYLDQHKVNILTMGDTGLLGGSLSAGTSREFNSPELDKYIRGDVLLGLAVYGSDKPGIYRPANLNVFEYVFNRPASLVDPLGLWSINFDMYDEGLGGGVTIGRGEGTNQPFFISLRLGAGVGYSIGYNPEGGSPSGNPDALTEIGFAGSASYRVGPVKIGKDVHFGVTHSTNGETLRFTSHPFEKAPKPTPAIRPDKLIDPKNWLGRSKSGYFAGEVTFYPENILPPNPIDLSNDDPKNYQVDEDQLLP